MNDEGRDAPRPVGVPAAEMDFGGRLRAAREERGMRQQGLANRTKMLDPEGRGISRTAIIGYEQGTTRPTVRELKLLCDVLHVSPNWLIYGTESAGQAVLPSLEGVSRQPGELRDLVTLAAVLTAVKAHERDALHALALSLAGRQLGDQRLSNLLVSGAMLADAFLAALSDFLQEPVTRETPLDHVADLLAKSLISTNVGNRFRLGDEGEILNPEQAVYPASTTKSPDS